MSLNYEQFASAYREAFRALNRYSPNQVGFTLYAEKMATLADAYPEFLERLELEVEEVR